MPGAFRQGSFCQFSVGLLVNKDTELRIPVTAVALPDEVRVIAVLEHLLEPAVIAAASTGALVSIIWLDSVDAWWAEPVATYLIMLILAGGSVGAHGGWALDDVDDVRTERKVGAQLITIALSAPLLIVLGKQALGVPLEASPGRWPVIVDTGTSWACRSTAATARPCLGASTWRLSRPVGPATLRSVTEGRSC